MENPPAPLLLTGMIHSSSSVKILLSHKVQWDKVPLFHTVEGNGGQVLFKSHLSHVIPGIYDYNVISRGEGHAGQPLAKP